MISMAIGINKKFAALALAIMLSVLCFTGCSKDSGIDGYNTDAAQNDFAQPMVSSESAQVTDDLTELDKIGDKVLSDGFWIADEEKNIDNPNDIYDCITYDYGFVFTPKNKVKEKDRNLYDSISETYDGIALTANKRIWFYRVSEDDALEIYRPYDSGEHKLMFTGQYDKTADEMYLYFTENAENYYDTMEEDSYLILTHCKDDSLNQVFKKLVFETWSSVSPDIIRSQYSDIFENMLGYENGDVYQEMRDTLYYNIDEKVQLFDFYYSQHEFDLSDGNAKLRYVSGGEWVYKAQNYRILPDLSRIEITPYEDISTYSYVTDKNMEKLVLENQGANQTIYRITNFTD